MPIDIQIANASFNRWEDVYRLLMENFAYMAERIDPPSSLLAMSVEDIAAKARDEKLLLAMDGPQVVGCAFLRFDPASAYIGKVAVDASRRGRGITRRLFALAEKLARERGLDAIELQTRIELTENHAAFAKLGFDIVGETAHEGFDRPTSITMRRSLAAETTA
ncbi:GNAT family N-acetyltransferase [Stappia sediminis]|uniref:GNAT family N-acetyltransferase n=1 Tax=Stappia sediminis TaxID=2692190 RepID=UPI0028B207D7|nr:GNAT family N-acetyltransferase [Stappia sediminis]